MKDNIRFKLNSRYVEIKVSPVKRLIDVLRDDFGLTGTKEGCGEGECGACAVMVDGKLVNSCLYPAAMLRGREVVTIEGLAGSKRFEVLKKCFEEAGAVQCGFCTPGMIMAAESLLRSNPHPTEEQIREGISGNLCRCTGYSMIVDAIIMASVRGEGLW